MLRRPSSRSLGVDAAAQAMNLSTEATAACPVPSRLGGWCSGFDGKSAPGAGPDACFAPGCAWLGAISRERHPVNAIIRLRATARRIIDSLLTGNHITTHISLRAAIVKHYIYISRSTPRPNCKEQKTPLDTRRV